MATLLYSRAMSTNVVRINEESKKCLVLLAKQTGETMSSVLDKAIEIYRRKRFLESVNEAYATLKADKKAWDSFQAEQADWDSTLMDGLESDEKAKS